MNCKEIEILMMKFIDKDINDFENLSLKQHLKTCKNCKEEFEILKKSIEIIEIKEDITPPKDFEKLVINKIKETRPKKQLKRSNLKYIIPGFILSSMLFITLYYLIWSYFLKESKFFLMTKSFIKPFISISYKTYNAFVGLVFDFAYEYYYFLILFVVVLYGLERLISIKLKEFRGEEA
jgi:hypothetical protein